MLGQKDKIERKLKKVKIGLMRNPKFALYSGVMMLGSTKIVDGFPTACTNGRDEIYGREFIDSLEERELAFVVMHETKHKAYRHLTTWRKLFEIDPNLCNKACDYVINLQLVKMDPEEKYIAMPRQPDGTRIGLLDERFAGMHTKQVFDILREEQEEGGGGGEGGEGDDSGGGGFDQHDWEGAKDMSEEEQKQLAREIDQALRQGQIAAQRMGKGAGGMSLELQELLTPKVDWREQLREFVMSVCAAKDQSSWRRVNRRFIGQDIVMPSLIGERVGRIVLGFDTSGSAVPVLNNFMSEAKSIFEDVVPDKVDIIYWDWVVAGHETYDAANIPNIVSLTQPKGGGGTDVRCMLDYMKKENIKPECIIIFTDGEVPSWGDDWPAPVLWAIHNEHNKGLTAGNGKTIHIEE